MKRPKRTLCVLLAFLLVLTGLNLQSHREQPVFGAEQPATGIAAFLSAGTLPLGDVRFVEDGPCTITPVLRQQSTAKADQLRRSVVAAAVWGLHLCVEPGSLVQRLCWGSVFPAPCWRAVTSHIHRTRRKRADTFV